MPTSTQPNAYAALEELGFYHHPGGIDGGGSYAESKHKMSCMFIPLNEWDEKAFNEGYDPKKDDYIDGPDYGVKSAAGTGLDVFNDGFYQNPKKRQLLLENPLRDKYNRSEESRV